MCFSALPPPPYDMSHTTTSFSAVSATRGASPRTPTGPAYSTRSRIPPALPITRRTRAPRQPIVVPLLFSVDEQLVDTRSKPHEQNAPDDMLTCSICLDDSERRFMNLCCAHNAHLDVNVCLKCVISTGAMPGQRADTRYRCNVTRRPICPLAAGCIQAATKPLQNQMQERQQVHELVSEALDALMDNRTLQTELVREAVGALYTLINNTPDV